MDDPSDIFQAETGGGDLDIELAAAGAAVQKVAGQFGVDLNSLSDQEVSRLLQAYDNTPGTAVLATKEAGAAPMTTKPTVADVSMELAKIASERGIDLSVVSREEYVESFDKLASRMSEPEKFAAEREAERNYILQVVEAQKIAEQEKLADIEHSREMGREMARAMWAEQLKIAEESAKHERGEGKDEEKAEEKEEKKEAGKAGDLFRKGMEAAKSHSSKAMGAVDRGVQRVGEKALNVAGAGGEKASPALKRAVTGGIAAGGTAAAAGTAGAVHHFTKKKDEDESKAAYDAAVIERAQAYLVANGFDPSTGEKLSEEQKIAASVDADARAMLVEAGFTFTD